jgi:hypothetical protein
MYEYNKNDIQNIDLAYIYTENYLKDRRSDISNLRLRQGTFLGFAGLLLRFNMELSNSQPSYLLTKIVALVTSFCSIFILGWALRAYLSGVVVDPGTLIEDEYLQSQNPEIKLAIVRKHIKACDDLYLLSLEQKKWLNYAINFLVSSAFFFTANCILVSFFGK